VVWGGGGGASWWRGGGGEGLGGGGWGLGGGVVALSPAKDVAVTPITVLHDGRPPFSVLLPALELPGLHVTTYLFCTWPDLLPLLFGGGRYSREEPVYGPFSPSGPC